MEEEFRQRHAEERDAGVTSRPLFDPHADDDETEREERPRDRVGHVAGKIAGERKGQRRADRKIIGDLDVKEKKDENHA